jgi:hypothetical protein
MKRNDIPIFFESRILVQFFVMVKKFFDHKIWFILSAAIAIIALVLLAAGLQNMHFQPGLPLTLGETTLFQVSLEKTVNEIVNIPLWKQVLFWVLVLLMIIIVAAMFSPDMRKRLIRYFLRLALFILALFYIVKNYHSLFPRLNFGGGSTAENGNPSGVGSGQAVFTPPHISSGLLYMITLIFLLILVDAKAEPEEDHPSIGGFGGNRPHFAG